MSDGVSTVAGITDETFRALDSGRKERLLPLGEPARMRQAAAHVTKFHLTQTDTEQYVTSLLAEDGKSRQVRFTAPQLVTKVKTLRSNLEKASTLRRVRELKGQISPREREEMAVEMERLGDAVRGAARMLTGKYGVTPSNTSPARQASSPHWPTR